MILPTKALILNTATMDTLEKKMNLSEGSRVSNGREVQEIILGLTEALSRFWFVFSKHIEFG